MAEKMEVDESMSDSEEEITVYAEFDDNVNIGTYRSIYVLGIDSKNPVLQMDDKFFQGNYEHPVGTYMFFEEDNSPVYTEELFGKPPEKRLKYVCKTQKLIKMDQAYVKPKEGMEQHMLDRLQVPNEDVELIDFSSIEEAVKKFSEIWPKTVKNKDDKTIADNEE